MNYKKIISSRTVRLTLLRCLSFIPDKQMLQMQYWVKTGRKLNLKNPQRYTEKLQWYKLFYRNPEMVRCVDKYDVRSYVEEIGLGYILNECYGVYDTVEEIDFNKLPNQFVLKDTLGGGGNSVIIVKDKLSADLDAIKKQMKQWVRTRRTRGGGREWPYYSGKNHRIIIEKYLEVSDKQGLVDYKFLCFYGQVSFIQLMTNRKLGEGTMTEGILNPDFNILSVWGSGHRKMNQSEAVKPINYSDMLKVAEILSNEFPHARVDLYNVEGKIVFGEITFFPASGYKIFTDDKFDYVLGQKFVLPNRDKTNCAN